MSERLRSSSSITRRDVVKGARRPGDARRRLSAGGSRRCRSDCLAAPAAPTARPAPRQRVAIIGAGAGGVAAAYLLGGTHDVDLFEARSKIGGHCDSHVIDYRGRRLTVDVGAQFFHPDTHPIYVTLLEQLGLYDPARPGGDDTLEAPASLCIFPTAGGPPVFSSSNPLATPHRALNFLTYIQLARQAVLSDLPWTTTVDAWIRGLTVSQSFKNDIVYPWITALIGSSRADALRASARSILQTFALAFPADVAQGATTFNSTIGLQGNLQRMLNRSRAARRAPQHGGARPEARPRRLVLGDAGRHLRALPLRRVERAATRRAQAAAHAARFRAPRDVTERVRILRFAHPDSHRPGLRAAQPSKLGGLQRRSPRSPVRGQRLVRRPAPETSVGSDDRRVQVMGRPPTRGSDAHPAGTAVQTPTDQPRRRSRRPAPWVRCKDATACTSAACTPPALTRRSQRSTRP